MLFTSIPFAFYFLLVFSLYWFGFKNKLTGQNIFLLISSYIFYGWFDFYFAILLLSNSLVNYSLAIQIQKASIIKRKKLFFISGLILNIGTLSVFKYFNFFTDASIKLLSFIGIRHDPFIVNIIAPIGISFYTFLSISYLVDVYQHKLVAVRNPVDVLLSFSFFPILLAGPIQRPTTLLPQIQNRRMFNYSQATDGLKQILWGLFMKILIADHCAVYVNTIFTNSATCDGSMLIVGVFLFTIQIYADFAGYSNLAIGIAKLMGFTILKNFAFPYFARDIREFWKRWNISLTTWFRDYVFLPVAYSTSRKIKADSFWGIKSDILIYTVGIVVTWLLTGLWHGANYTFIVWGLIQGFFLVTFHVTIMPRKRLLKKLHISKNNRVLIAVETGATFILIMFSWIFFRSDSLGQAVNYISRIASSSLFTIPQVNEMPDIFTTLIFVLFFLVIEWLGKNQDYAIATLGNGWPKGFRRALYVIIILAVFWFSGERQQFIYFQF